MRGRRMAGTAHPFRFTRAGTALGWSSLGAMAIRSLAVKRGKIGRLSIEELEVGRLRVRELIVEQEHKQEV